MSTEKQKILELIRHLAAENGGKAPGGEKFTSVTGIGKSEWYPKLWLRWGDAVREAGFEGNSMSRSIGQDVLIRKYIELIRELQRFSIEGDLIHKRLADKSFPNRDAFNALGGKRRRAAEILKYCRANVGHEDVSCFCESVASSNVDEFDEGVPESSVIGFVYLLRHGTRREYKIGRTYNPIRREGEIGIELPERAPKGFNPFTQLRQMTRSGSRPIGMHDLPRNAKQASGLL